jgi:hypothetical protein
MSYGQSTLLSRSPNDPGSETGSAITTENAVQYLLGKLNRPSVREQRVQALLFIAEANWHDAGNSPPPLLDTEFQKIRRGVFSSDVRRAIDSLNLRSRPSFRDDIRMEVYDISLIEPPNRDDISGENVSKAIEYLDAIVDSSEESSTEELMKKCLTFDEVKPLTSGETIAFD